MQLSIVTSQFIDVLLAELFTLLSLGKLVERFTDQLLDFNRLGTDFIKSIFKLLLKEFLFLHRFAEFCFQVDLDGLVEGLVDLLHVVNFIF